MLKEPVLLQQALTTSLTPVGAARDRAAGGVLVAWDAALESAVLATLPRAMRAVPPGRVALTVARPEFESLLLEAHAVAALLGPAAGDVEAAIARAREHGTKEALATCLRGLGYAGPLGTREKRDLVTRLPEEYLVAAPQLADLREALGHLLTPTL